MTEMIHSSEMSVLITATGCNIPKDRILHSHCHEIIKCYIDTYVDQNFATVYNFLHTDLLIIWDIIQVHPMKEKIIYTIENYMNDIFNHDHIIIKNYH
jgi:hypothetical protein